MLHVHRKTVQRMARRGYLPGVRKIHQPGNNGLRWDYDAAKVIAFLESGYYALCEELRRDIDTLAGEVARLSLADTKEHGS